MPFSLNNFESTNFRDNSLHISDQNFILLLKLAESTDEHKFRLTLEMLDAIG